MNLKKKLLLPLLTIPAAALVGLWLISAQLDELQKHTYQEHIAIHHEKMLSMVEHSSHAALEKAALFSRLPVVVQALELAQQGDINDENDAKGQEAREMLRTGLQDMLQGYREVFNGNQLKVHFHLPNGHSLARLWLDKQIMRKDADGKMVWLDVSDDISSFRSTVLDVNREGKAVMGLELGRAGLDVRGIAPIKTSEGKTLGSVEVLVELKTLLDAMAKTGNSDSSSLFFYLEKQYAHIIPAAMDSQAYPRIGDYVQLYATNQGVGRDFVTADLLAKGQQTRTLAYHQRIVLAAFPLQDYKRQKIGALVYTLDISPERQLGNAAKMSLIWTLAAVLIVLGGISYWIGNRFVRVPIRQMLQFVAKVHHGDQQIELRLNSRDELGDLAAAMNQMVCDQRHVLGQIHHAGVQVTSSTTQLAATAKEHRATILQQVDSTRTVSDSVEQITQVIGGLKTTVDQVAGMSAATAEFASHGQADLARMKDSMQQMEAASRSISGRLEAINEKTENITGVVTTITKVAEQTNLLSLNAAIEAEKAGEYGHGFNVVAREIRRLADQTAVATLDIESMVKEMQSAVAAGVMEMDKFIGVVRYSAEDVSKISGQLGRIIDQVKLLSPSFKSVKDAMEHQSTHARQIRAEMAALSEGMQQTSETLQESFLAIEQLNQAARGLQNEVERFKVTDGTRQN